jgi:hypothetical protein
LRAKHYQVSEQKTEKSHRYALTCWIEGDHGGGGDGEENQDTRLLARLGNIKDFFRQ